MEVRWVLVDVVCQLEFDCLQVDWIVNCCVVVRCTISLLVNWLQEWQNLLVAF